MYLDEAAEAPAHNAGTDLQPLQRIQINTPPPSVVPKANPVSVNPPLRSPRWTGQPARTCTRCSGWRWRGTQRSRSCPPPVWHQLYEWSFEKQPQFELHLRNTAKGTEVTVTHGSEQHGPLSAFLGSPLLKSSWLLGCTPGAELMLKDCRLF